MGVGPGVMKRIREAWETGKLSELEEANLPLAGIPGLGPKLRKRILETHPHITTAEELAESGIELPKSVRTALLFVTSDRLQRVIPREDVSEMEAYLKKLALDKFPGLELVFCGSYRRHQEICRDVDVLMFHKTQQPQGSHLLPRFVRVLIHQRFLQGHLTHQIHKLRTKYMGFCEYGSGDAVCRIDIRHVPFHSRAPAILYFTGSAWFNRAMRQRAKTKGYRLNEYGLYSIKTGHRLSTPTEESIFDALGLAPVPVANR